MSKLKKLILILAIIIVMIIGVMIYILNKYKAKIIYGVDVKTDDTIYDINSNIKRVDIRNNYYAVKTCINKFYIYYSSIFNIEDVENTESIANRKNKSINIVYQMLDEEYLSYYNITEENLINHLKEIEEMTIHIRDMYVTQRDENIGIYFVNGQLINSSRTQSVDFSIMVKMDMLNHTFSILLDDYVKENYNVENKYLQRMNNFFEINDTNNCERIYNAIVGDKR